MGDTCRLRGRPADDGIRVAGKSSGGPLRRDYLTKFEAGHDYNRKRDDGQGLVQYQITRAQWQTKKYDHNWMAHSDIPRPHRPSDLTGYPKVYFG